VSNVGSPHIGDVHRIRITVKSNGVAVPLTGPITFRLKRPTAGTTFDRAATLTTDGSDGKAEYLTAAGELDEGGTWEVQLKDGSGPWRADVIKFQVLGNLPDPS
jgi:hypothetical protein